MVHAFAGDVGSPGTVLPGHTGGNILPALTVAAASIALPRILSGLALPDARTAVWDAARLAGWNLTWTDEAFSGATVADGTGTATFRFDEQARITNIESSLHPQG